MATIFYAWKSEHEKLNRYFIKDAIERSAKVLGRELDLVEPPRVDEATAGVAGWPDVIATILEKIEACDVFVADLTNIEPSRDRVTPNPNVIFELGYAFAKLDHASIVCIVNIAFFPAGKGLDDMPFDIRGRRGGIQYSLLDGDDKARVRTHLVNELAGALRLSFEQGPIGRITAFLDETNPEIRRLILAGQRSIHIMVAQQRMPALQRLRRPTFERFLKVVATNSFAGSNTCRIGNAVNDVADGPLNGYVFALQPAFVMPR